MIRDLQTEDGRGTDRLMGGRRKTLRAGGVYLLPDGQEVIVGVGRKDGRLFLFHPAAWSRETWILNMPIAFEVDQRGRILTGRGKPTGWWCDDVTDTGSTLRREQ